MVAILHERNEVTQLVDQRDEKCIFIQVAIDANTVMVKMSSVTIITQNRFSLTRNGQMNFIVMEIVVDELCRTLG